MAKHRNAADDITALSQRLARAIGASVPATTTYAESIALAIAAALTDTRLGAESADADAGRATHALDTD